MILRQFYLGCLAQASYLIGDERSRRAIIVDPQRDIDHYLSAASDAGLTITDVILTHVHADFAAGHLELRDRVGARVHLGHRANPAFEAGKIHDGDVLTIGDLSLEFWETPGHTLEAISILVRDHARPGSSPTAVLTGDTLFIGDVGRPDLQVAIGHRAEDLASMLFDSVHRLLGLPDATLLYPAHGAGSLCGKHLSTETVSTIGAQRTGNYACQPMSRKQFIAVITADQPAAPAYFAHDAQFNLRDHQTEPVRSHAVTFAQALELVDHRAQVLDVRDAADFLRTHWRGSLGIGLHGSFAPWAGALLNLSSPVVLITDPGQEQEAARRLARIGFEASIAHLAGGMAALAGAPSDIESIPRLNPGDLDAADPTAVIVDVRSPDEHSRGSIPGALNIPLGELVGRLPHLPRDRRLVVHCAGGYRSAIGAGLLQRAGFEVADLMGGYAAWRVHSELLPHRA